MLLGVVVVVGPVDAERVVDAHNAASEASPAKTSSKVAVADLAEVVAAADTAVVVVAVAGVDVVDVVTYLGDRDQNTKDDADAVDVASAGHARAWVDVAGAGAEDVVVGAEDVVDVEHEAKNADTMDASHDAETETVAQTAAAVTTPPNSTPIVSPAAAAAEHGSSGPATSPQPPSTVPSSSRPSLPSAGRRLPTAESRSLPSL